MRSPTMTETWRCAARRPYSRPYEENSLACVSVRCVLECPRVQRIRSPGAVSSRAGYCLRGSR